MASYSSSRRRTFADTACWQRCCGARAAKPRPCRTGGAPSSWRPGIPKQAREVRLLEAASPHAKAFHQAPDPSPPVRKSLGPDVVLTRGDEEVGVDPEVLRCDAVTRLEAIEAGASANATTAWI